MSVAPGRIEPGRQLGFIWGATVLVLIALVPFADSLASRMPACAFRGITGMPCATCGTTTAAVALAHADPLAAFRVSPLATVAWIGFVLGGLIAGVAAMRGRGVRELPRRVHWGTRVAAIAVVLGNWAYLVLAV